MFEGEHYYAHRLAWEIYRGPIPEGIQVLHRCDVKRCVRPTHLFLGTQRDNVWDCIKKGRFVFPPKVSFRGEKNPSAKITDLEAERLKSKRQQGILLKDLSRQFGLSMGTISQICNGRRRK